MGISFSDLTWFVAVSKPNGDDFAKERLKERGYEVFAPKCRVKRSHARKIEVVERPLFPRYVFVGCSSEQPFHPLLSTPGVSFLLRSAYGIPLNIRPGLLREIERRCERDGGAVNLVPEEKVARFKPGQTVRVTKGPMAGLEAVFVKCERTRVAVMLSMFGREAPAQLSIDEIDDAA